MNMKNLPELQLELIMLKESLVDDFYNDELGEDDIRTKIDEIEKLIRDICYREHQ